MNRIFTLVLAASMTIGNIFPQGNETDIDVLNQSFKILKEKYVDEINDQEIIKSSIQGMVKPLDPYTVLLEGERKEALDMVTKGKYGGVGIQISTRRDTLIVSGVMEDSPAYSEGLQVGDKIISVDSTSTIGYSTKQASELIKGEIGTRVLLKVLRPSTKAILIFELTRDEIMIKDVPYYGVDEAGIGYIRITKFSRYTAKDFREAIIEIAKNDDLNGLVIDLRSNSGGLLSNAISILDYLVERNTRLLETRGRIENANNSFYSRRNPEISRDIPLAVLINHSSASASEIVAGTLQDLDRAVIVGEKSFGKGLVQSMFSVNDSTKLKITTAKYYTPSGRLIQKFDYLDNGVLTDGLDKHDSTFTTIGGRQVKGGGGITPDVESKRESIPQFVNALWQQGVFLTFAATYVPTHDIPRPLIVNDRIVENFKDFLQDYHFEYQEPGEREFGKMKDIIIRRENLPIDPAPGLFARLMFWKKHPQDQLFSELNEYFSDKKRNPFGSDENLAGIQNGLYREMSSVITGRNADRIRASLSYDTTYEDAKSILLDANRYYAILSPGYDSTDMTVDPSGILTRDHK